jgi:predicted small lipoprotein YifL
VSHKGSTPRLLILAALAASLSGGLAGCGRRGALELPPEAQARAVEAAQQDDAATAKRKPARGAKATPDARPKLSEEGQRSAPAFVPGTPGHRPPAEYPFLLDPLL